MAPNRHSRTRVVAVGTRRCRRYRSSVDRRRARREREDPSSDGRRTRRRRKRRRRSREGTHRWNCRGWMTLAWNRIQRGLYDGVGGFRWISGRFRCVRRRSLYILLRRRRRRRRGTRSTRVRLVRRRLIAIVELPRGANRRY